ncbi:MAG: helix-turn-helix domain-containing protein [Candidatus Latescibacterota bacterium]
MDAVLGAPEETLSRREREKAAHRREILQAAMRVFARKGFAAATIDEIAQEAEFSKGTVYLHFASKEDLLSTILLEMHNTAVTGLRQALAGTRSLREELTEVFRNAAEFAFSHLLHASAAMPMHLSQVSGLSEETRARHCECHEEVRTVLYNRVVAAQEQGEIRPISAEAIAGLLEGTLNSMVMTRWDRETVEELQVASGQVLEIIFEGIAERRG